MNPELYQLTTDDYTSFSIDLKTEVDRIFEDENVLFSAYATFVPFEEHSNSGIIKIPDPKTNSIVAYKISYAEPFDQGFYWSGKTLDSFDEIDKGGDRFTYIKYKNFIHGDFNIGDDYYHYELIGEDKTVIYQVDENDNAVCGNHDVASLPSASLETVPCTTPQQNGCDVDIVAMYTERFRKRAGGLFNYIDKVTAKIQGKISELNYIRQESQLDVSFKFRLVGIFPSEIEEAVNTHIVDGGDWNNEYNLSFSSGEMKDIRDTHNADVLAIFTHGKYTTDGGAILGGKTGTRNLEENMAFILMEHRGLKNTKKDAYTFPHEIFHVFAAQHVAIVANGVPVLPYAEYYYSFNEVTVMQPGDLAKVVDFLSNPDIFIDGENFGSSTEDNARVVSEGNYCVSNFRGDSPPPFSVSIDFLTEPCPCSATFLEAITSGASPLSYDWAASLKGPFDYVPIPGNSTALYFIPCSHDIPVWFKLTVTDGNGVMIHSYKTAFLNNCNGAQFRKEQSKFFSLTPNPVLIGETAIVELSIPTKDLPLENALSLEVLDLHGRLLIRESIKENNQGINYRLGIEKLVPGLYYIIVRGKGFVEAHKLVVQ